MKNNIMLSLLAMTSASVGAYAAIDMTGQIKVSDLKDWTSTTEGFKLEGGIITSPGAAIEQEIGSLLPGKYQLTWDATATSANAKVLINGKVYENGVFTLTETQIVTIRVESTDGKGFTVGGFKLVLDFDFAAYKEKYQFEVSKLRNLLIGEIAPNDPKNTTGHEALLQETDALLNDIAVGIKIDSYESYEKYELYKEESQTVIALRHADLAQRVAEAQEKAANLAANSQAYTAAVEAISELETALTAKKPAEGSYEAEICKTEYESIATEIATQKQAIEDAKTANDFASQYNEAKLTEIKNNINGKIGALSTNIAKAQADHAAYVEVKPLFEAVKALYTDYTQVKLHALLPGEPDVYGPMLLDAQGEMAEAYTPVSEAFKALGTDELHPGAQASLENNKALIAAAETAMAEIYTAYETKATACKEAYKEACDLITTAEKKFTTLKTKLANVEAAWSDRINEISTAITNFRNKVEADNHDHVFQDDKYQSQSTTIATLIENLYTDAERDVLNYDAKERFSSQITELQAAYNAQKEEAGKVVSEDKLYKADDKFPGLDKQVNDSIKTYTEGIQEAFDNDKAVAYEEKNKGVIQLLIKRVGYHMTDVMNLTNKYNTIQKALNTDSLSYDELEKIVANKAVIVGGTETTYGSKLTSLKARIDAIDTALKTALAKNDQEHIDAMKALSTDETIGTEISALKASYANDEKTYNDNVVAITMKSIYDENTARIEDFNEKLKEYSAYTEELVGSKLEEIGDSIAIAGTLVQAQSDILKGVDLNNTAHLATLIEVRTALAGISNDKITPIYTMIQDAVLVVKNNNEAQTALTTSIQDNLLDYLNGNEKKDIEGLRDLYKDPNKEGYFMDEITKVEAEIQKQEAAITASRAKETLPEDKAKIEEALGKIKKNITTLRTEATNAAANYQGKNALLLELINKELQGKINDAKTKVNENTADDAGRAWYIGVVNDYQAELDQIGKDIEAAYNAGKAAATTVEYNTLQSRINTLLSNVKAVGDNAKINHETNKELTASMATAKNFWSDVFTHISTTDQSAERDTYLERLNAIQDTIQAVDAEIATAFGKGELQSPEEKTELIRELDKISKAINNVSKEQSGQYESIIGKENDARYDTFLYTWNTVRETLEKAQKTVRDMYYVENPEYKVDLEFVNIASEALYEQAALLNDLKADAAQAKADAVGTALYDPEEAYTAKAKEYEGAVADILKTFNENAYVELRETFDEYYAPASAALVNAQNAIDEYDEGIKETAFSDIQATLDNALSHREDVDLAIQMEGIVRYLKAVEGELAKAIETATVAQWNLVSEKLTEKLDKESKEIASNGYQSEEEKNGFVEQYDNNRALFDELSAQVEGYIASAEGLFPQYSGVATELSRIESAATDIYELAKNASANNQNNIDAYNRLSTLANKVQGELDAVVVFNSKFVKADKTAETIDRRQGVLSKLVLDIEGDYESLQNPEVEAGYTTKLTNFSAEITLLYNDAIVEEAEVLTTYELGQLKSDYNLAEGVNAEEAQKYQAAINGFKERIEAIRDDIEKDVNTKQNELLGIEGEMAAIRTALTDIYDPEFAGITAQQLQDALDAVAENAGTAETTLADCAAPVQEAYKAKLEAVRDQIAAIQASIDKANEDNTVIFYSETIAKSTSDLADILKETAKAIADAQVPYTVDAEVFAALSGEIEALQQQLEEAKNTVSGYTNTPIEGIWDNLQERINKVSDKLNALHESRLLTTADKLTDKNISSGITSLLESTTRSEYGNKIDITLSAISGYQFEGEYTEEVWTDIDESRSLILQAFEALSLYNDDTSDGISNTDIDGNQLDEPITLDYMSEAIPAIDARYNELAAQWEEVLNTAAENRFIKGDIDNDGAVFVTDYNLLLNIVLGKATVEEGTTAFYAANVNNDEKINIGDVAALVNKILEDQSAAYLSAMPASETGTDALSLAVENEGGIQRIAVSLSSAANTVGLQMDIKLPAGMMIMGETLGESLSAHQIYSNDLGNGTHRIVIASLGNAALPGSNSPIFYLDVNSTEKASQIALGEVLLTNAAAQVRSIGSQDGQTTGIQGIENDKSSLGSKIYDLGGRLMNSIKQGIHIIRKTDGSSEKVMGE